MAGGVSTARWCEHRKDPVGSIEKRMGLSQIPGFQQFFVPWTGLTITVMDMDWKLLEFALSCSEVNMAKLAYFQRVKCNEVNNHSQITTTSVTKKCVTSRTHLSVTTWDANERMFVGSVEDPNLITTVQTAS